MPPNLSISFVLPGHPQGKGRARAARRGKFISMYTPAATRSYEGMIRDVAASAMGSLAPFADPVAVEVDAIFDVPASWSKKKRAAALDGTIWPGKKPDATNILKAIEDACNGVVFKDDALICYTAIAKRYGPAPRVEVSVRLL